MADVLVRNLEEKTHRQLKRLAKQNGRSVNAEILAVLDQVAEPKKHVGLGTAIHEFAMQYGGFELEIERDRTPARYPDFSGPEYDPPEPK
jgi:plasmid stability protein